MKMDLLSNRHKHDVSDKIKAALEYLTGMDAAVAEGRYPVLGEDVVALVSEYQPKPVAEACFEAHRQNIDVHAVLSGSELVGYWPQEKLKVRKPYEDSQDVELYDKPEKYTTLLLTPGSFMIFYQQDGHMPSMRSKDHGGSVKKVVFKIKG